MEEVVDHLEEDIVESEDMEGALDELLDMEADQVEVVGIVVDDLADHLVEATEDDLQNEDLRVDTRVDQAVDHLAEDIAEDLRVVVEAVDTKEVVLHLVEVGIVETLLDDHHLEGVVTVAHPEVDLAVATRKIAHLA
jgi:hypothetical protein